MKKLTIREKLLIYILACFLIGFFGIYFVIIPSYENYQVVSDQAAEAQFTKESMEMAIDSVPSTMQARDEATTSLAILEAPFPQKLTNEGLDMLLTQLCLDYSLAPKVLAIESNGLASVSTFTVHPSDEQPSAVIGTENTTTETTTTAEASTSTANTQETTNTTTSDTTETTTPSEGAGGTETWTGVVNMELTGTQANFYRLLDAVAARSDMIISSFEIAPAATAASGTTASSAGAASLPKLDGGNSTINVTFTVYMVDR